MSIIRVKNWLKKDSNIFIEKKNSKIFITNNSNKEGKLYSLKIFRTNNQYVNVNFKAKVLSGSGAILTFLNRKKARKMDCILNSQSTSLGLLKGFLLPVLVIKPYTKIEIDELEITLSEEKMFTFTKYLGKKDILLITPSYPSPDNLYACGFVHSRVKEYVKMGIDVDVVSVYFNLNSCNYSIDNINVYKTDYSELRQIIMAKAYKAILVHFFDEEYGHFLDSSYLNDIPIFLWNHGADILFWDYKDIYTPYFKNEYELPKHLYDRYKLREKFVEKFAKMKNYNWIFVSNSEKKRAITLNHTKFNNSIVIPNFIDSKEFLYEKKSPESRKKIFILRRFDNTKKYAIDIAVLTILELSRRKIFNDLEFFVCGEGSYHTELVEPIKNFKNVNIINNFLSHEQIVDYHKKCGIALFPTRQDTQGVSALEAASSGLVVITSDLEVIHEYFDEKLDTICPIEEYIKYADVIEDLYKNPEKFQYISKKMSEFTESKCSIEKTIVKEIEYIKDNLLDPKKIIYPIKKIAENPILTVAIPSYNSEKFLDKCLLSLLKSPLSYLTEILVINDGSKDNTKNIGLDYQKLTTINGKSIVKLVDKENGGHGSGINKGIELANGKYFKVIDSDDWVDTDEYTKLIEKLITEDADMILSDYCEARSFENKPFKKEFYNFLSNDVEYNLNDICIGSYGFQEWGPSLPTTTYKTECLRKANFKLLEKTFYVDMIYNAYSLIYVNSVKKYDLNIYRYYIGNIGQSVSKEGMMKNYKHHENVILELMKIITNDDRFTNQKTEFIINKLLLPMVDVQYYIYFELFHSRKKFIIFEERIKEYKNLLIYHEFNKRRVKFHRITKGIFVNIHPFLKNKMDALRKIKNKLSKNN